jgi:hypothetical protein
MLSAFDAAKIRIFAPDFSSSSSIWHIIRTIYSNRAIMASIADKITRKDNAQLSRAVLKKAAMRQMFRKLGKIMNKR